MSDDADNAVGKKGGARCPMCGRPTDAQYRPFCSKRCANIDLSRWLSGGYVIPDNSESDGEEFEIPVTRDRDNTDRD